MQFRPGQDLPPLPPSPHLHLPRLYNGEKGMIVWLDSNGRFTALRPCQSAPSPSGQKPQNRHITGPKYYRQVRPSTRPYLPATLFAKLICTQRGDSYPLFSLNPRVKGWPCLCLSVCLWKGSWGVAEGFYLGAPGHPKLVSNVLLS